MTRKMLRVLFVSLALCCGPQAPAHALSPGHHVYLASRRLCAAVGAPFYGALVQGPKDVKKAYVGEVWDREKPEDRGLLRNRLYGMWRAPGQEAKAILDGIADCVAQAGAGCKELISIFFGD